MAKQEKLTPKQAVQVMKGGLLFMLASMEFHGLIDKDQWTHWVTQFKRIDNVQYALDDEKTNFEDILKKGGRNGQKEKVV